MRPGENTKQTKINEKAQVFSFVSFIFVCFVFSPGAGITTSSFQIQARVLVFSKTSAFRHDSIPDGINAIRQLGTQNGFEVDATEDASTFNDDNLARYRTIVFLSTTGEILNTDQQAAFERFIRKGGGFAGIHSASDTEYDWPWYGGLVGTYFKDHPVIQTASIKVEDGSHPSTSPLPVNWTRNDEWYNFRSNPRGRVRVLATLDETSYSGGSMGIDHPISWCQLYDGGRSWYTAGGHTRESYSEPLFRQHLLGGIQFAAGLKGGSCSALSGVSAASFNPDTLAIESIASIFGSALSTSTESAINTPLPTILAGTSVKVKDSAGNERMAPLFFVSPGQINFLVPVGSANGASILTVVKEDGSAPSGNAMIDPVAPALFAANANGQGVAAGVVLRVRETGSRIFESIAQFDQGQNKFIALPIDLGPSTDEVFLVLFGTGIRYLSSQSAATIKIGGSDFQVLFAGLQGTYAGLDQVNVKLTSHLRGRGEVDVVLTIESKLANMVSANIK